MTGPPSAPNSPIVQVSMTEQKIADMYGCSREYVNKLLARYKNASPN